MSSDLYFNISLVDCILNSFLILYVIILSIRLLVKAKYNYFYAYEQQKGYILVMTAVLVVSFATYIAQDVMILLDIEYAGSRVAQWFIFAF